MSSQSRREKERRKTGAHLHDSRIRQHLSKLPHSTSNLGHHQIHHPVFRSLPILPSRTDLHQAQEASVSPEGVVLEIDRDVSLRLQPRDQLPETSERSDVGEGNFLEGCWRGRVGCGGSEKRGRVRDVGELVGVRVRRRRRSFGGGTDDSGAFDGRKRRGRGFVGRVDVVDGDLGVVLDEGGCEGRGVGFVDGGEVDLVRWLVEEDLRFGDGSVGDGCGKTSCRRWSVEVDGGVLSRRRRRDASGGKQRRRGREELEQTFERAVSVGMMGIEGGGSFPRKLSRQMSC